MKSTLVAYFSATGATKRLAEKIANTVDADIFEIEPTIEYTNEDLKWPSRNNRTSIEMRNKRFRPGVVSKITNSDEYDEVFLGFPIWYYTAPTIVNTFIEQNNLQGKKVYVFATSGVHDVNKSFRDLQGSYPDINFISAKRFSGTFYPKEVFKWIGESELCSSF